MYLMKTSDSATRILDSAQRLIQERGVKAMSYADISEEVGVGKPTIHHHFATKAKLVEAVADRYLEEYKQALNQIMDAHESSREQLTAYTTLFQDSFEDHQHMCLCGMLASDIVLLSEGAADTVNAFSLLNLNFLTRLLIRAQEQGELAPEKDPSSLAALIFSSLEGALLMARGSQNGEVLQQVCQHVPAILN